MLPARTRAPVPAVFAARRRCASTSLIDDIAQRVRERLVVVLDRDVVIGVLAGQVAAQATGVEDRQAHRRTESDHLARRAHKPRSGEALASEEWRPAHL